LGALLEVGDVAGTSGTPSSRLLDGGEPDVELALALAPSARTLDMLLHPLGRVVECESYALYLAEAPDHGRLRLGASDGRFAFDELSEASPMRQALQQVAERANMWLVEQQKPLLVEDFATHLLFADLPPPARAQLGGKLRGLLGVPLMAKGRAIGTLVFYNKMPSPISPTYRFTAEDLRLVAAYARPAAVALENAMLYRDMHGVFLDYVRSVAAAVDAKDRYTHGHSQRVAQYSVGIGWELGLPAADIELIELSGTLHDVGKIAVHDQVLNKAGKLTDEDWRELKSHPAAGAGIVEKMTRLRALVPGLRNHHERYDGTGYPDRLAGEAIPLLARIIAVADAYDAMTTVRVYRKALDPKEAHAEIVRCSGTQFDPRIAEAFLCYRQKGETPQAVPAQARSPAMEVTCP
jgi:HD-GYP domain-containing protein (c-di-GMP phosphodiesterase class II)